MITAPSVWGKLPALAISSDIARRVTESTRGRHGSGSSCRVCPQRHRVSRSPGSGAGYIWHRRRSQSTRRFTRCRGVSCSLPALCESAARTMLSARWVARPTRSGAGIRSSCIRWRAGAGLNGTLGILVVGCSGWPVCRHGTSTIRRRPSRSPSSSNSSGCCIGRTGANGSVFRRERRTRGPVAPSWNRRTAMIRLWGSTGSPICPGIAGRGASGTANSAWPSGSRMPQADMSMRRNSCRGNFKACSISNSCDRYPPDI